MKKIIFICLFSLALFCGGLLAQSKPVDQCVSCHLDNEDEEAVLFQNDIHFQKGLSCASCHGGDNTTDDMDAAMDTKAGFIGVPKGDKISETCASCHANASKMKALGSKLPTNQFENLKASVHGISSKNGKERVVQCITCHNAHGIVSVKNPKSPVYPLNVPQTCAKCHSNPTFMRDYSPKLPVDQLQKYRTSVHGLKNAKGDFKTAECVSCHGSHDILAPTNSKSKVFAANIPGTCSTCHSDKKYMKDYNIPTDQYEKYSKSIHGIALLKKGDTGAPACNSCHGNHGAVPPGVQSISNVCGTCHALNAELFSNSPHKKAFDKEKLPECETCHSNHLVIGVSNKLLGTDKEAVCSKCHTESKSVKGYRVAKKMRALMDSLDYLEQDAIKLVNEAEQKGMEISETKFKLKDVHTAKLQSRTAVHSFNEKKFEEVVVDKGINTANIIRKEAVESIDDYYFRRKGLTVSIFLMFLLAGGLYLYIKQIEKK